jgi:hypothetical protein
VELTTTLAQELLLMVVVDTTNRLALPLGDFYMSWRSKTDEQMRQIRKAAIFELSRALTKHGVDYAFIGYGTDGGGKMVIDERAQGGTSDYRTLLARMKSIEDKWAAKKATECITYALQQGIAHRNASGRYDVRGLEGVDLNGQSVGWWRLICGRHEVSTSVENWRACNNLHAETVITDPLTNRQITVIVLDDSRHLIKREAETVKQGYAYLDHPAPGAASPLYLQFLSVAKKYRLQDLSNSLEVGYNAPLTWAAAQQVFSDLVLQRLLDEGFDKAAAWVRKTRQPGKGLQLPDALQSHQYRRKLVTAYHKLITGRVKEGQRVKVVDQRANPTWKAFKSVADSKTTDLKPYMLMGNGDQHSVAEAQATFSADVEQQLRLDHPRAARLCRLVRDFDHAMDKRGLSQQQRTVMLDSLVEELLNACGYPLSVRCYGNSPFNGQTMYTISGVLGVISARKRMLHLLRAKAATINAPPGVRVRIWLCERALSTDAVECMFAILRSIVNRLTVAEAQRALDKLHFLFAVARDPARGFSLPKSRHAFYQQHSSAHYATAEEDWLLAAPPDAARRRAKAGAQRKPVPALLSAGNRHNHTARSFQILRGLRAGENCTAVTPEVPATTQRLFKPLGDPAALHPHLRADPRYWHQEFDNPDSVYKQQRDAALTTASGLATVAGMHGRADYVVAWYRAKGLPPPPQPEKVYRTRDNVRFTAAEAQQHGKINEPNARATFLQHFLVKPRPDMENLYLFEIGGVKWSLCDRQVLVSPDGFGSDVGLQAESASFVLEIKVR